MFYYFTETRSIWIIVVYKNHSYFILSDYKLDYANNYRLPHCGAEVTTDAGLEYSTSKINEKVKYLCYNITLYL